MAVHATHATNHELKVLVDDKPIPEGPYQFVIRCIAPDCATPRKELSVKCTDAYFGVHAVGFHAAGHEGHAYEAYLDGNKIHPPT